MSGFDEVVPSEIPESYNCFQQYVTSPTDHLDPNANDYGMESMSSQQMVPQEQIHSAYSFGMSNNGFSIPQIQEERWMPGASSYDRATLAYGQTSTTIQQEFTGS